MKETFFSGDERISKKLVSAIDVLKNNVATIATRQELSRCIELAAGLNHKVTEALQQNDSVSDCEKDDVINYFNLLEANTVKLIQSYSEAVKFVELKRQTEAKLLALNGCKEQVEQEMNQIKTRSKRLEEEIDGFKADFELSTKKVVRIDNIVKHFMKKLQFPGLCEDELIDSQPG